LFLEVKKGSVKRKIEVRARVIMDTETANKDKPDALIFI
jgi:hypothetical protein